MPLSELTFPECDYGRTGLKQVVCQLRFNPILKISQYPPADFQELMRPHFPLFEREDNAAFKMTQVESAAPVLESFTSNPPIWKFYSHDRRWSAGLAFSFVSLETHNYRNFEEFFTTFDRLMQALVATYAVEQFTRVGLRYINRFTESDFPGDWRPRINHALLGPVADGMVGPSVKASQQRLVIAEDDWSIGLTHGFGLDSEYVIDIDHSTEKTVSSQDIPARLADFNRRIFQVFRWSISDQLHVEMEPTPRD